MGQKVVKPQVLPSLGGGGKLGNLHLDHLVPSGLIKAIYDGGALLPGAAGHLRTKAKIMFIGEYHTVVCGQSKKL